MKMCIHYWLFNYEGDKKAGQLWGILNVVEKLILYGMVVNFRDDQIFVDFIGFLIH